MISLPGSKVPKGGVNTGAGRAGGGPNSSNGGGGGGGAGAGARETYSTHAISEDTRILFTSQLRKLREEEDVDEVCFPPTLDNIERKYLHHLADQLGLASKSRGKGEQRFITVYKKNRKPKGPPAGEGAQEDWAGFPPLDLSPEAVGVLQTHLQRFRLTDDEREVLASPECMGHQVGGPRRLRKASSSLSSSLKQADGQPQARRVEDYLASQRQRDGNVKYRSVIEGRRRLPAWEHRQSVVQLVKDNQVVIVSGDTGCGKSTQVPQFLLDDAEIGPTMRMIVTQPQRISAIALADRIASERLEEVGKTIGYNIRLESEVSDATQVTFMTPGVLLRRLTNDPQLTNLTHIIIDEVHERDRNTDFLLIILRDLLAQRQDLRLILMSATLQLSKLSAYFGGCPVATIGSMRYPVQVFYLEDVLLQTGYVKLTAKQAQDPLLRSLCSAQAVYTCEICRRRGFRSPEELGTHVVLCDGGQYGLNCADLEMRLLRDLREDKDYVPDYEDWNTPSMMNDDDKLVNGEGSGVGGWSEPTVRDVLPPTKATDIQAQEVLRAYQFDWDDQQVDYRLIRELLHYICDSGYEQGAGLVFLPGWDDISRLRDLLQKDQYFGRTDRFLLLPLHSGIPSKQQREVFKKPPPGVRKLILATNIAETSITIDDVTFVVDSARVKEKTYDPYLKLCTLSPTWISRASARQRREFKESEILTTPLEELCLQAKSLGLAPGGPKDPDSVSSFLAKAMDPPHALSVKNALELLEQIGALDQNEQLTDLGWHLSSLPLDPRLGKMLLWGQLLGCAKSSLKIGCAMGYRDPFVLPLSSDLKKQAERVKVQLAADTKSDHIALLNALDRFEESLEKGGMSESIRFCDRFFLSRSTMATVLEVVRQLVGELGHLGFSSPMRKGLINENDRNLAVLSGVICAGLYPNVARRAKGEINFNTSCKKKSKIHSSSINGNSGSGYTRACSQAHEYMVFSEMIRTPQLFLMSTTTPAPVVALLLLCGSMVVKGTVGLFTAPREEDLPGGEDEGSDGEMDEKDEEEEETKGPKEGLLELDGWITYRCPVEVALSFQVLRHRLQHAFLSFVRSPQDRLSDVHLDAVKAAVSLLTMENKVMPRSHGSGMPGRGGGAPGRGGGGSQQILGRVLYGDQQQHAPRGPPRFDGPSAIRHQPLPTRESNPHAPSRGVRGGADRDRREYHQGYQGAKREESRRAQDRGGGRGVKR